MTEEEQKAIERIARLFCMYANFPVGDWKKWTGFSEVVIREAQEFPHHCADKGRLDWLLENDRCVIGNNGAFSVWSYDSENYLCETRRTKREAIDAAMREEQRG